MRDAPVKQESTITACDWAAATNPGPMLLFLLDHGPVSDRKLRLLATAAASEVHHLMCDGRSRVALRVAEAVAEGVALDDEWSRARGAASEAHAEAEEATDAEASEPVPVEGYEARIAGWRLRVSEDAAGAAVATLHPSAETAATKAVRLVLSAEESARRAAVGNDGEGVNSGGAVGSDCRPRVAALLRCIFGDPFAPITFLPEWRTEAAVSLARGIYEDGAWERLPVLADALEDAGCDSAELLKHCREPGGHVKGCHVIDAILGQT